MKYIKQITPEEMNKALLNYFDVATKEDFWEVKGLYARNCDLCYSTLDGNCFYCLTTENNNFVYFALRKDLIENIKGLWEVFYQLVCLGYPFIRINGRKGRYPKILKSFCGYKMTDTFINENEEFLWYIGHPDNVNKFLRRFN